MDSIAIVQPHGMERLDRAMPEMLPDAVLMKTLYVSICSTDISYFHGNLFPDAYPIVPGHEYVGEVVEIGREIQDVQIGDRVVYFGQGDFDGLADYRSIRPVFPSETKVEIVRTSRFFDDDGRAAAIVVDPRIPSRHAPLLEPITAVLRSLLWSPPRPGDNVLILGAGPCGQIAGCIIKSLFGVNSVSVVDRNRHRLAVAAASFARGTFASGSELESEHDESFDYVFDSLPPLTQIDDDEDPRRSAMRHIRPGGTYVLYGASQVMQKFDTWLILSKGIRIVSAPFDVNVYPIHKTANVMKTAQTLLSLGLIDADRIISDEVRFAETDGIIDAFANYGAGDGLKTIVRF